MYAQMNLIIHLLPFQIQNCQRQMPSQISVAF